MICNLQVDSLPSFDIEEEADFDFDDLVATIEPQRSSGNGFVPQFIGVQKTRAWDYSLNLDAPDQCKKTASYHRSLDVSEYRDVCKALF